MDIWIELFLGNSYNLSVTIGFINIFGMGIWFTFFFISKLKETEAEQNKEH